MLYISVILKCYMINDIHQCCKGNHRLQPDLLLGGDCPAGEAGGEAHRQAPEPLAPVVKDVCFCPWALLDTSLDADFATFSRSLESTA